MYTQTQKLTAEIFGTFILVFFGCGTAMMTGGSIVPTSLAFGLSIVAAAYTIGPISGAHLNPAVSFGMFFDGRMTMAEAISYTIAQLIGAFVATLCHFILVLFGFFGGEVGSATFGANGFSTSEPILGHIGAFISEAILTCIFVLVILCVTQSEDEGTRKHAGLFIALALTFVHLLGIGLTGTSVNPARSIPPAIFAAVSTKGESLIQLWVFIIAPIAGSFLAALINHMLIKKKPDAEK